MDKVDTSSEAKVRIKLKLSRSKAKLVLKKVLIEWWSCHNKRDRSGTNKLSSILYGKIDRSIVIFLRRVRGIGSMKQIKPRRVDNKRGNRMSSADFKLNNYEGLSAEAHLFFRQPGEKSGSHNMRHS